MSRQPYVRPMPKATWYMRNGRYRRYMFREVTCLLVGIYSFLMIWGLAALAAGSPDRWNAFLASQQNTAMVVFHGLALIYFLVYMTFDWFKLAPKAMPLQLGEKKLPELFIVAGHYAVWILVSLFVFWLVGALS
jgi:fumarate reductase subunit C